VGINLFKKYKDRPKIKIEPTAFDKIIDALSFVFLILLVVMVIQHYPDLPERIPTHFDKTGQADEFGPKTSILLLPVLTLTLFAVLKVVGKFPHKFNYVVKITPENAESQYKLGTRIMRFVNLFVMLVLYYTAYKVINTSMSQETPTLDKWFAPVVLGVSIFGVIAIFVLSFLKNKKTQ